MAPNKLQGRLGNGGHIAMDEMSENEMSGLGYVCLWDDLGAGV